MSVLHQDKKLTGPDTDPILKMQGVPWVVRKAIGIATVYLDYSVYTSECSESPGSVLNIDIHQTATAGLAGTSESRRLDWNIQTHSDYIFGVLSSQSRLIDGAADSEGTVRPDVEVQTKVDDDKVVAFLKGKILPDGTPSIGFVAEGSGVGGWVHTFASNQKAGWTAEQVWGFEMIDGLCCHTRRCVVADSKGAYRMARLVYTR
ncbi:hypothetical protein N7495_006342 [Penicillium taxi]|uniref:uncharacterized protein n=1 Tax=Penicillium taxi TaxID=168475 RepID=UPI00254519E0|nr:uncharacterized protein N7495_006342 [Penicillium taxi]KAJ5894651.1 hypothetical protein N7495_006342 [Penicillium taxi]